jgi:ATP-dependent protease ClpP protease subunit
MRKFKVLISIVLLLSIPSIVHAYPTVILEKGFVPLTEEITSEYSAKFIKLIIESQHKDLTVFIDSPGGSVFAGQDMINAIQGTGKKVNCVINNAASMAFSFIQAACGGRDITSYSVLLQHQMSTMIPEMTPIEKIKSIITMLDQINIIHMTISAKRMGLSLEQFKLNINNDWMLVGQNAIDKKAADRLVNIRCSKDLVNSTYTKVVEGPKLFGIALEPSKTFTFSSCPLITEPISVKINQSPAKKS